MPRRQYVVTTGANDGSPAQGRSLSSRSTPSHSSSSSARQERDESPRLVPCLFFATSQFHIPPFLASELYVELGSFSLPSTHSEAYACIAVGYVMYVFPSLLKYSAKLQTNVYPSIPSTTKNVRNAGARIEVLFLQNIFSISWKHIFRLSTKHYNTFINCIPLSIFSTGCLKKNSLVICKNWMVKLTKSFINK